MSQATEPKSVLITGAAQRVGAATVRLLHSHGMNITLHYRSSTAPAQALQSELNALRPDSVTLAQADLHDTEQLSNLVAQTVSDWGRLDVLINNASSFYPTPVGKATPEQWDDLIGTNMKAPFFLAQAAAPHLRRQSGCIINMVDIYAERPLPEHPLYVMAKAGLMMMTKSLAIELGPEVRVNAVAPGAILWPETGMDESQQQRILDRTALKHMGNPGQIAKTIRFLIEDADYTTGQVIAVDGGRSVMV